MAITKHWTKDVQQLPATVSALEGAFSSDHSITESNAKLYFRRPTVVASPTGSRTYASIRALGQNLTRRACDAASSMLAREVQVKLTPVDTDHVVRKNCSTLQTLCDGVKDANGLTGLQQRWFLDAEIAQVGFLKVFADPETFETKIQRLHPLRCYWDDNECENGEEPLSFFYVDSIPLQRLLAEFPKHAKEIRDADKYEAPRIDGVDPRSSGVSENRKVIEAWARKVGKTKGKHVIMCGKAVLFEEEYEDEHLPIASFRYSLPWRGWSGISLASLVAPYDLENKEINDGILTAIRAAKPRIFKHSSETTFEGITDEAWEVVEYNGDRKPEIDVPQVISRELLDRMASNTAGAMAEAGINEQLAAGNRPGPNLNSEPAQRAAVDIAQIRLVQIQERWGEAHRDLTRAILMVMARTYRNNPEAIKKAPGTKLLEKVDWSGALDLKESQYNIATKLASGISLTWAGRLADIKSLRQEFPNAMSEGEGLAALRLPDVEGAAGRMNAHQDEAERLISRALNDGKIETPPNIQPLLERIMATGTLEYVRAQDPQQTEYPPEHVEQLRKLLEKTRERLQAPAPPPAAPPPPAQQAA